MDFDIRELTIERLGGRGEGVARGPSGPVYVPYALPGERVRAYVERERARVTEIIVPSPDRIPAFCPHFGTCGGCAIQNLAAEPYAAWKRGLVVTALEQAKVVADVAPLVDAHGEGRRRATFHARFSTDAAGRWNIEVGFMQARAHNIIDIDQCPILAPSMVEAAAAARAVAEALSGVGKPLDILVNATLEGLDIDLRGAGPLEPQLRRKLAGLAERIDLARLANHGDLILERRPPRLLMGRAYVRPPAGAFLQATDAGEAALVSLVSEAVGPAKKVADLFSGVGTFALRLGEGREVLGIDGEAASIAALRRAAGETPGLQGVHGEVRDLYRRPLAGDELARWDAVVFDPPRAGAEAQARALGASAVPKVVAVSCSAGTFARDAKILVAAGYALDKVTPVDQFRHAPHVEIVGVFSRPKVKAGRRGRLLG